MSAAWYIIIQSKEQDKLELLKKFNLPLFQYLSNCNSNLCQAAKSVHTDTSINRPVEMKRTAESISNGETPEQWTQFGRRGVGHHALPKFCYKSAPIQ